MCKVRLDVGTIKSKPKSSSVESHHSEKNLCSLEQHGSLHIAQNIISEKSSVALLAASIDFRSKTRENFAYSVKVKYESAQTVRLLPVLRCHRVTGKA